MKARKRILFASPWWHSEIVNGVIDNAAKRRWRIDLETCLSGRLPEVWSGDGYISMLGGGIENQNRFVAATACPGVTLNENHPEIDLPIVTGDKAIAGRLAAEHLMERGFRTYAFYSYMYPPAGRPRYEAFADRLAESGHDVQMLSWPDERPDGSADHRDWLRRRLIDLPKPVGLFAFNDQQAAAVIDLCVDESIAVPDEVAVLGVLDMDIFRHCTGVALSSIAYDFDRITATACDLLADLMDGKPAPAEPITIPPEGVVVRESTDTLAAHTPVVARAVRFMLDHFAEPIDTDTIVAAAGGSRGGLFKAFRADMDRTPGEALTRIRLDKAKRMLAETDEKVYAVADACGFGKPFNLHRAFTRYVGRSPNAYRHGVRRDRPVAGKIG